MNDVLLYVGTAILICLAVHSKLRPGLVPSVLVLFACMMTGLIFHLFVLDQASSTTEILSGKVEGKAVVYDPTTENYACGTDSKGNTKWCQRTVPRWRFDVKSDVGTWRAHRYSPSDYPSVYARAVIGEPFARAKAFNNYQLLSEQTILNKQQKYEGWLPEYPEVYDGYRVDRAISQTVSTKTLSKFLSERQKVWGPQYGVNVIMVIVPAKDAGFAYELNAKWVGGRKNDAVIVIYHEGESIKNVDVFSRSTTTKRGEDYADFNGTLKANLYDTGTITNLENLMAAIDKALPLFEREELEQYSFLASEYSEPWYMMVLGVIAQLIATLGTLHLIDRMANSRRFSY